MEIVIGQLSSSRNVKTEKTRDIGIDRRALSWEVKKFNVRGLKVEVCERDAGLCWI